MQDKAKVVNRGESAGRGDELLKRLLKMPPKPNKGKDAEPKPGAPRLKKDSDKVGESLKDGRKAK